MFDSPILIDVPRCIFCSATLKQFYRPSFMWGDNVDCFCPKCPNKLVTIKVFWWRFKEQVEEPNHSKYLRVYKDNDLVSEYAFYDKTGIGQRYSENQTTFYRFGHSDIHWNQNEEPFHIPQYISVCTIQLINIDLKIITDEDIETYMLYS